MTPYDKLLIEELSTNDVEYNTISISMCENDYNKLNNFLIKINHNQKKLNSKCYSKKDILNLALKLYINTLNEMLKGTDNWVSFL